MTPVVSNLKIGPRAAGEPADLGHGVGAAGIDGVGGADLGGELRRCSIRSTAMILPTPTMRVSGTICAGCYFW